MVFEDKLKQVYDRVIEEFNKLIEDIRENLRVKPKYIEVPEKYYEALREEQVPSSTSEALSRLSLKIKADNIINHALNANRELNKIYDDLKMIEKKFMDYIDKAILETRRTIDELWSRDITLNDNLRRVFKDWSKLEETRKYYEELIDSLAETLKSKHEVIVKNYELLESSVSAVLDELNNYIEEVKAETRDHRKILFRYINFAEGVRTKGVKLYLPAARVVFRDSRGRIEEIMRIYNGNLKLNNRMIETARRELEGIDDDFVDALRKYVRANYGGLRRFFLLMVLKKSRAKR